MEQFTLGVISRFRKADERRLPIHPGHLDRIAPELRDRIYLERGYGETFGVSDDQLAPQVAGLLSRSELIARCDVVVLAKPMLEDVAEFREGQTLWGWPHCVQDAAFTQVAIDKKLNLIAFEAMNYWTDDGSFNLHVFHQNNEMAGYCSVLHALATVGSTGEYGRRLRAVVIGFGATARGAVTALNAHGVHEVDVLTHRGVTAVAAPIHSARIVHFERDEARPGHASALTADGVVPVSAFLAQHDIVVNCVLQDTDAPLVFLDTDDLGAFAPGSLIIDVSCDVGMGFSWARPTTFVEPTVGLGRNLHYYAVDHSPSYLWNSATWELSTALLPFLRPVLAGPAAWQADETIRRALEIQGGVIRNPAILSFQHRSPEYPHLQAPPVSGPA